MSGPPPQYGLWVGFGKCAGNIPAALTLLSLSIDIPEEELKHEYHRLRPDVVARMDTHLNMTEDKFRRCVVESLSEVDEKNRGGHLFKALCKSSDGRFDFQR